MPKAETSIGLTEEADRARQAVTQPTWRKAFLALVGLVTPRSVDNLREQAEENREKHPFLFLIARQTLDRHGRTAATDDDDEAALTAEIVDIVTFSARLNATGVINLPRGSVSRSDSTVVRGLTPLPRRTRAAPFLKSTSCGRSSSASEIRTPVRQRIARSARFRSLQRTRHTLELDDVLASVFGLWDLVLDPKRRFHSVKASQLELPPAPTARVKSKRPKKRTAKKTASAEG